MRRLYNFIKPIEGKCANYYSTNMKLHLLQFSPVSSPSGVVDR